MSSSVNRNHQTTMSLNDRFTAFTTKPNPVRRRSRSRSVTRGIVAQEHVAVANDSNRRLLQQLVRKETMRAALKLKRRSMRTPGGGGGGYTRANLRANNGLAMARGSVKAIRVAANGVPIKTNSLSRVATMKADLVSVRNRRPMRRRSNSVASITGRLGGAQRPMVGGAAQRVAQRRMERGRGRGGRPIDRQQFAGGNVRRGRSRSRSRGQMSAAAERIAANLPPPPRRGRSLSRNRAGAIVAANMPRRGRSRSRSRSRVAGRAGQARPLPIKARLGLRPGTTAAAATNRRGAPNRRPSINRRGIAQGRVQKRGKFATATATRRQTGKGAVGGDRTGRARGRAAVRGATRGRSQSRNGTRRVFGGQQQKQQPQRQNSLGRNGGPPARRGRSQQRGGGIQRNGKPNTNGQQAQQQQRRGRSRSRGRGGRGGARNIGGQAPKQHTNKDDLDKELDQYMATTKTENNMDYLLKN